MRPWCVCKKCRKRTSGDWDTYEERKVSGVCSQCNTTFSKQFAKGWVEGNKVFEYNRKAKEEIESGFNKNM